MANENKLQDIIKTSLENIRSMVDANTVIGDPINTESGTTIIPISKISLGFASGGLDYTGKDLKTPTSPKPQNFGGGGGTGLSVVPVGFLIVSNLSKTMQKSFEKIKKGGTVWHKVAHLAHFLMLQYGHTEQNRR